MKFENGLEIFWHSNKVQGDPTRRESEHAAALEIFDWSGHPRAQCDLSALIRAADPAMSDVSIYDVSARNPGYIAIAAVYARTTGGPVALLLLLNWDGSLLSKVFLDQQPQIESLEMDEAGHVWALNSFDRDNPADFVFTEFASSGAVLHKLVRPRKNWSTDEGISTGGQTSFGLTSRQIWAWLPKSQTLILTDIAQRAQAVPPNGSGTSRKPAASACPSCAFSSKENGAAVTRHTGLPQIENSSSRHARRAVLLPDGRLLMDVSWVIAQRARLRATREEKNSLALSAGRSTPRPSCASSSKENEFRCAWYVWSARSGWQRTDPKVGKFAYLYALMGRDVIFSGGDSPAEMHFQAEPMAAILASVIKR